MFTLIIEALSMSTLVGLTSFFLYSRLYKGGHTDAGGFLYVKTDLNEIDFENMDKKTGHFALDKWISLGGGYYGTVAVVKLVLSEFGQTLAFLKDREGLIEYFNTFGIGSVIDFFINQIQMFIEAIIWPVDSLPQADETS